MTALRWHRPDLHPHRGRLPLAEAPEGSRLSDAGEAVKVVLTP
ncbi:hypothetical protein ACQEVX_35890 [Streptomyces syringium]